jgi:hypothetical protein
MSRNAIATGPDVSQFIHTQQQMPMLIDNDYPDIFKIRSRRPVNIDSIEAMTTQTDYLVRGTFIHIEYPGQSLDVACKYYKDQRFFAKRMNDQQEYVIPYSVARHINERILNINHKHLLDSQGNAIKASNNLSKCKFIISESYKDHKPGPDLKGEALAPTPETKKLVNKS